MSENQENSVQDSNASILAELSPEARAIVEASLAETAEAKAKVAELEALNAPKVPSLQGNGFLTVVRGGHQEWIGKECTVEYTVKAKGTFQRSKSGNASLRLTFKVPEDQIKIVE